MLGNRTIQIKLVKDDTPATHHPVGNPHPKPGEKVAEDKGVDIVSAVMAGGFGSYIAIKAINLAFKVAEHKLIA